MKPNIYDTNVYIERIKKKYPNLPSKDLSKLVTQIDKKLNDKAYNAVVKEGGDEILKKVANSQRASLAREIMLSGGTQAYRESLSLKELASDNENKVIDEQVNLLTNIRRAQPLFASDNNLGGTGPIAAMIPDPFVSPKTRDQRALSDSLRADYQRAVSGLTVSDAEARRLEQFLPTKQKTEQQNREDLNRLAKGIQINQKLFELAKRNNLTANEAYNQFGKQVFEEFGESWDEASVSKDASYTKSPLQALGEGVLGFGRSIVKPIEKTAGNIGTGIVTPIQALLASFVGRSNPEQAAQIASADLLGTRSRAEQISQKAQDKGAASAIFEEGVKPSLGTASFAVPFGKGANIATKALIPGAASGGLYAASEENATPESVAAGAATGSLFAGALSALSSKFGAKGAKAVEKAAEAEPSVLSKNAKTAIKGVFEIPKNKATRRLNMDKVAETVLKHDFLKGAASFDDLAAKADDVVNLIEPVKRDALAKVPDVEIPNMIRSLNDNLTKSGVRASERKAIKESVLGVLGGSKQTQIGKINAIDGYDMAKQLEKLADGYIKTGVAGNPTAMQTGQAINQLSQEILDQLDDRLASIPLTELKASIIPEIAKYSQQLADDLAKAKTFRDFRALQSGFVQLSQAAKLTADGKSRILQKTGSNTALQVLGGVGGGIFGNVPGAIAGSALAPAVGAVTGSLTERATLPITRLFSNLANKGLPKVSGPAVPSTVKKLAPNASIAALIKLLGGGGN